MYQGHPLTEQSRLPKQNNPSIPDTSFQCSACQSFVPTILEAPHIVEQQMRFSKYFSMLTLSSAISRRNPLAWIQLTPCGSAAFRFSMCWTNSLCAKWNLQTWSIEFLCCDRSAENLVPGRSVRSDRHHWYYDWMVQQDKPSRWAWYLQATLGHVPCNIRCKFLPCPLLTTDCQHLQDDSCI